jgi:hypothetical protein
MNRTLGLGTIALAFTGYSVSVTSLFYQRAERDKLKENPNTQILDNYEARQYASVGGMLFSSLLGIGGAIIEGADKKDEDELSRLIN